MSGVHAFPTRPKLVIERRGARVKTAMPRWSHQRELDDLIGKRISVTLVYPAVSVIGTLLAADQFALQLDKGSPGYNSVVTYYKHAIRSYEASPAVAK